MHNNNNTPTTITKNLKKQSTQTPTHPENDHRWTNAIYLFQNGIVIQISDS